MSGRGARPRIDIVTKSVTHDSASKKAKKHSTVQLPKEVKAGKAFKMGIRLADADVVGCTVTSPPGVNLTIEDSAATVTAELNNAFPHGDGKWYGFTGTAPDPSQSLTTELQLDNVAIDGYDFRVATLVFTYDDIHFTDHYLVATTVIPGEDFTAREVKLASSARIAERATARTKSKGKLTTRRESSVRKRRR